MRLIFDHIKKLIVVLIFVSVFFVLLIQPAPHINIPFQIKCENPSISETLLMKSIEDLMQVEVVFLTDVPLDSMVNQLLDKSLEDLMSVNVG